jgi:hypothetical protein
MDGDELARCLLPPAQGGGRVVEAERQAVPADAADRGRFAMRLQGALAWGEAAALIAATERHGYVPASLFVDARGREVFKKGVRDSDRCIVDSPQLAAELWRRLGGWVPRERDGREVVGFNERMRFLRYDAGQKFEPHYDAPFVRDAAERTYITLLLYLNDGYEGGATTFYSDALRAPALQRAGPVEVLPIAPVVGMALLHDHDVLHAGTAVARGRKYVLRTDVLYRKPEA